VIPYADPGSNIHFNNLTASDWTGAELPAIEIYRTQKLGFFQCPRISRDSLKELGT